VARRRTEFESTIQRGSHPNGPWFFYSGFSYEDTEFYKQGLDTHLGLPYGQTSRYLRDVLPDSAKDSAPYKAAGIEYYYWSANSKAFAQAVRGDAYLVTSPHRPINRARAGEGSVWWSYGVPELTRSGKVTNIYVLEGEKQINMYANPGASFAEAVLSSPRKIWTQNDELLGFPVDERYHYSYPSEALKP
jgi:hypothetical protein